MNKHEGDVSFFMKQMLHKNWVTISYVGFTQLVIDIHVDYRHAAYGELHLNYLIAWNLI